MSRRPGRPGSSDRCDLPDTSKLAPEQSEDGGGGVVLTDCEIEKMAECDLLGYTDVYLKGINLASLKKLATAMNVRPNSNDSEKIVSGLMAKKEANKLDYEKLITTNLYNVAEKKLKKYKEYQLLSLHTKMRVYAKLPDEDNTHYPVETLVLKILDLKKKEDDKRRPLRSQYKKMLEAANLPDEDGTTYTVEMLEDKISKLKEK